MTESWWMRNNLGVLMNAESARQLLSDAGMFFYDEDDEIEDEWKQTLNMNDVWGWATAWGEYVPDDELPEVARLFKEYGWCGILYWVSRRNDNMRSEFFDVNRFVDFVAHEEAIRTEEPSSSKRAYLQRSYTLGSDDRNDGA